jgi:hypothetical protein
LLRYANLSSFQISSAETSFASMGRGPKSKRKRVKSRRSGGLVRAIVAMRVPSFDIREWQTSKKSADEGGVMVPRLARWGGIEERLRHSGDGHD